MLNKISLFSSNESLIRFISSGNRSNDLLFFLLLIFQISILPSMPVSSTGLYSDEWISYVFSSLFDLFFYLIFYYIFYRNENENFIREIIAFSVVARVQAFIFVGILSIIQISLWSSLKKQQIPHGSLIFYVQYISVFTILMTRIKNKEITMRQEVP